MSEPYDAPDPGGAGAPRLPESQVKPRVRYSWIWLTPLVALGLVAYLIYSLAADRGPLISITFVKADGLTEQQTHVKYKAVTLGTVETIELSPDLSHVVAKVRMTGRAKSLLTADTRFWVVRPRLGSGLQAFQAGLETLVSGAYVAIEPGSGEGELRTHFEGLEEPPSVRSDEPGTVYHLEAESLGGLNAGAPIFCRDVEVGRVLGYDLVDNAAQDVRVRIFVRAPYDTWVTRETRFWNASGVHVGTSADGLEIELQSVQSLFSGSVAFHTPRARTPAAHAPGAHTPAAEGSAQSPPESTFRLHPNRDAADSSQYPLSIPYVSYFQSSIRGLAEGSEVHMFGRRLGSVTSVELVTDPRPGHTGEIAARVAYVLQPERALVERDRAALQGPGMRALVESQLRVVLETSSLLTGQKNVSLTYVPGAAPAPVTSEAGALVLPSATQGLEELTTSVSAIASNINSIPFGEIGANLNRTLASLDRAVGGPELARAIVALDATFEDARALVQRAQAGLDPVLLRLPAISERLEHAVAQADTAFGSSGYGTNSTAQRNLERMMDQIADAARSIRLLADYLNRHPEAVLSGRKAESQ